jgi:diguanylate cyclase
MVPALPDLLGQELRRPWYARSSRTVKDLYAAEREQWRRRSARISAHVAGAVYVIFAFTDYVLVNDVFAYNLLARLTIGLLFIAGTETLFRFGVRSLIIELHCATATVLAYGAWLLISGLTIHQDNMRYYAAYGVVFMLGQNVFFNFRFWIAAASSTFILIASQVDIALNRNGGPEYFIALGALYASTYTLTLYVNWRLNEERFLVFLNAALAEIRQREAMERGAALLRLSTTDALTGLANRRAVDEELTAYWQDWQTQRISFAVVLVDVDYFKLYNDRYGHQEGDRCLMAVANAMATAAAENGYMVGRFGGEEFILVAPSPSREHVKKISETIRKSVEDLAIRHDQRPDGRSTVTVSVGAAFSQDVPDKRVERLITEADRALYGAKESGRNCVKLFDQDSSLRLEGEESLADLLRIAEDKGLVSLVYQPIVRPSSGEIVGAEALMRLKTTSGKHISPAVFIPMAERMGVIVRLGLWAIRTACRQLITTDAVPFVTVNVSPIQLRQAGFSLTVAKILADLGIPPSKLVIEITESLQIEDQPEILKNIRDLKILGVPVWLDDFGTGFAGLSCIREVEFDAIKLDRSFLHASTTARGSEMFRSIVSLVRSTGCGLVVEGIETEEQRLFCVEHEVDYLQGYHLGRPAPAETYQPFVGDIENASRRLSVEMA